MDVEITKNENLQSENQQLKDRLIAIENENKQLRYNFKKVILDQQYLIKLLAPNNESMDLYPQFSRISKELPLYLQLIDKISNGFH